MKKLSSCLAFLLFFADAKAQFNGAIIVGPQSSSVSPAFTYAPDTVARTSSQKTGIRFGIVTHIPLSGRLQLQTGIVYSAKGTKEQQVFDPETTGLQTAITDLSINYIDAPLNLLVKLPLKGKTSFLLGAGPQLSLFYTGKYTHNLIDKDDKYSSITNEDLPVGKGEAQFRTLYFSANALAGFEFGRVFITAHYAKGLNAFYQKEKEAFKFTTLGATLGIHLGKPMVAEPVVKDKDGDGVPDALDACPLLAGSAVTNGCPDGDGDGIADKDDRCATVRGSIKYNGCPVPDGDGDGMNDEEDDCPAVAGLAKYGGCPMPDVDQDGVADEDDACPDKAGVAENKGCPVVTEKEIEKVKFAATRIQFEFQSTTITADSYKNLDVVVSILKNYPQLNIAIEGHTAGLHNEANLKLSQQRAQVVKAYFVSKGIDGSRLTANGFGSTMPIVPKTEDPRNRRVEIKLSEEKRF